MSTRHRAAIVRAQDEKAFISGPPPASATGQKQWFALQSSMRRKLDEIAYTVVQDLAMYELATTDLKELEAEWVTTPTSVHFNVEEKRTIAEVLEAIGSMCETQSSPYPWCDAGRRRPSQDGTSSSIPCTD